MRRPREEEGPLQPFRLFGVSGGDTLREEEGGCRLNCAPQGGGGGPRYGMAASQGGGGEGRLYCEAQGGGGASPYLCGGILREEEGGCRLNPDPREEEGVGYSILTCPKRLPEPPGGSSTG